MATVQALAVCLMVAVVAAQGTEPQKPEFCKSLDCPLFTEEAMTGYTKRSYTSATNWVGASEEQYNLWLALGFGSNRMFQKLFQYINSNGIAMTAPVLVDHEELSSGWFGRTKVTMWFYLTPRADASPPPQPTDASVTLTTLPAGLTVYVNALPKKWWPLTFPWEWNNALMALRRAVGEGNYVAGRYFTANYDEPTATYKHNEVMLVPTTSAPES